MNPSTLFDLSGRVALVTGASTGIGRAIAEALASAGADVGIAARRTSLLEVTLDGIEAQGRKGQAITVDLEKPKQIDSLIDRITESLGAPDIVVNCAGVNFREPYDEITEQSWRRTLDINLSAPFFLARACVPAMKQKGWGRIVNIASLQSRRAFPDSMPYGASKGGIEQLTRAMAEAWSRYGINCNAIAPGFFPTELTRKVFEDPNRRDWASGQTAIGRNGEMQDLHGVAIFLASHASDYITGQTLFVDGGFTAR